MHLHPTTVTMIWIMVVGALMTVGAYLVVTW